VNWKYMMVLPQRRRRRRDRGCGACGIGSGGGGGEGQQRNYYLTVVSYLLTLGIVILLCITFLLHGHIFSTTTNNISTPTIAINESEISHNNNKHINSNKNDDHELQLRNSIRNRLREDSEYNKQLFLDHEFVEALDIIKSDFGNTPIQIKEHHNERENDTDEIEEELKLYYCTTPSSKYQPGNNRISTLILTKKKKKNQIDYNNEEEDNESSLYTIEQRIIDDGKEDGTINFIYCPAGWPCTQSEPQYKIFEACNGFSKDIQYICDTNPDSNKGGKCWIANNGLQGCCEQNEICHKNDNNNDAAVFSTTDLCHTRWFP